MRPLVWVVDDSPLDLEHARRAIGDVCETRGFSDGSAVLELLSTTRPPPPDVLVIDWMMPGVTGIEVVRFMRSEANLPQIPVLLLTGRNEPQQIVDGLSSGANDYLPKPYHDEELRARVAALVRTAQLLERARKAEESVRVLLANSPDALLVVDAQGRVTFASEEAGRLFGRPLQALVGDRLEALAPDLVGHRNISIGDGTGLLPLPDVTVNGRVLSPSLRVLPTDTAASTTIAFRDVTERRRAEARRVDFYSVMAHDLRSPLNATLMRVDALLSGRRGPLSAEAVNELRKIEESSRGMAKMIKDFLDLARMEGVGYKIARERLDLAALATKVVEDLRPLASASGLALVCAPPPSEAPVVGDRDRLAQVLSNLVGNAIKFTPAGGKVTVQVEDLHDAIRTTVSDTGPGIAPELVPFLFNRFTQGASAQRAAGWGLGLMIVREIVDAHGGRIDVRTEAGKGSTFGFRIPRAAAVAA